VVNLDIPALRSRVEFHAVAEVLVNTTVIDFYPLNISKDYALKTISVMMGGRIAEELAFDGSKTTGAGNDIERATEMARSMVCEWGMSDRLGPLTFGKKQGEVFLGREMGTTPNYSEQTARDIDDEVRTLVVQQYDLARKLLEENYDVLMAIADALMEHETLDGPDLDLLMGGGKITRERPNTAIIAKPAAEKKDKKNILDALEGLGKLGSEPGKA